MKQQAAGSRVLIAMRIAAGECSRCGHPWYEHENGGGVCEGLIINIPGSGEMFGTCRCTRGRGDGD
jgi:hypothetical protein